MRGLVRVLVVWLERSTGVRSMSGREVYVRAKQTPVRSVRACEECVPCALATTLQATRHLTTTLRCHASPRHHTASHASPSHYTASHTSPSHHAASHASPSHNTASHVSPSLGLHSPAEVCHDGGGSCSRRGGQDQAQRLVGRHEADRQGQIGRASNPGPADHRSAQGCTDVRTDHDRRLARHEGIWARRG